MSQSKNGQSTGLAGITRVGPERSRVRVQWIDQTGRRKERSRVVSSLSKAVALRESLKGTDPTVRVTRQRFRLRGAVARAQR